MTSRSSAGFTLLEMLVVLAIIALAASSLPVLTAGSGLDGSRMRAEADRSRGTLREPRDRALRRGCDDRAAARSGARSYAATVATRSPLAAAV